MIIEDAQKSGTIRILVPSSTHRDMLDLQQRILPSCLNSSSLKRQPGDDHPRLGFEVAQVAVT